MRLLIACVGTLFLVLVGCNALVTVATLVVFSDDPLYVKAVEAGSTKHDLLAIRQPDHVTPTRGAGAECFEYKLKAKAKRRTFHVVFTEAGKVNSHGFSTCASALSSGYFSFSELPERPGIAYSTGVQVSPSIQVWPSSR